MSVLIRGMEMPKECRECPMMDYGTMTGGTYCEVNGKTLAENYRTIEFDGRPDWCPLVELPEKHGDLIDRDVFRKEYRMGDCCQTCETDWKTCHYDQIYSKMDFCVWIDDTHVIIEAEDET